MEFDKMLRSFFHRITSAGHILGLSTKIVTKYMKDLCVVPFTTYTDRIIKTDVSRSIDYLKNIPPSKLTSQRLVYIGCEEDSLAWKLDTDYRVGGNSVAALDSFPGYCNLYLSPFPRTAAEL